jgi:hypothetical protein
MTVSAQLRLLLKHPSHLQLYPSSPRRSFIQGHLVELPKAVCAAGVIVGEDELVDDIVDDCQKNNEFRILMVQCELIVEVSHLLTPMFVIRN